MALFVTWDGPEDGWPVVCTHGVGDTSSTWKAQVPALVEMGARVARWDLRGHGRSTGFTSFSRDDALADLASVTPPGALHVGHSLGGYLALALAVTQPELVGALFLVATGPGYRDASARERWNSWLRESFPGPEGGVGLQPDSLVVDGIRSIGVATALVVGEGDHRYHDGMSYLGRVLGADVVTVPAARHHVHETDAEAVNGVLTSFCRAKVRPHAT